MDLNELKNVWKQQDRDTGDQLSKSELMMMINNKMISLEENIKARDRLEIIVAIAVMIVFALWGVSAETVWTQAGCAVIVGSAGFIWYKLKRTQRASFDSRTNPHHSMREHLNGELQSVRQQKKMLQSVAWWYLSPIWVGLLLITLGFSQGIVYKVGYMIAVSILYVWIWRKNQQQVEGKFSPLEEEIKEAIASIEDQ